MQEKDIDRIFEQDHLDWNEHSEKAVNLFEGGYNCSQSVFGAFCEDCGIDRNTALGISSSFGGGMGRLREVCGAVTGGFMVLGLRYGNYPAGDDEKKARQYELVQDFARRFEARFDSYLCRDLLDLELKNDDPVPEKRTPQYYIKRPCALYVAYAAALLDKMIKERES